MWGGEVISGKCRPLQKRTKRKGPERVGEGTGKREDNADRKGEAFIGTQTFAARHIGGGEKGGNFERDQEIPRGGKKKRFPPP